VAPISASSSARLNGFSFALLNRLAKPDSAKNVFVSPLSAHVALSLVSEGAKGATKKELLKGLGFDARDLSTARQESSILRSLGSGDESTGILNTATGVWTRKEFQVNSNWLKTARESYDATVKQVDFSSPDCISQINQWASEKTNGRIPQIVNRNDAASQLLLLNAVYFKAKWAHPFKRFLTEDQDFHTKDGSKLTVSMMSTHDRLAYAETAQYQAVALPYQGNRYRALIVVPKAGSDLAALTGHFDGSAWGALRSSLSVKYGELKLPRVRLDYDCDLKPSLKALGVEAAFDGQRADFSGIATYKKNFCITGIMQKSFLAVNEQGTEAAAITKMTLGATAIMRPPQLEFTMVVDRPFLFAIENASSGALVFIGEINNPGKPASEPNF
jgi:serpin B